MAARETGREFAVPHRCFTRLVDRFVRSRLARHTLRVGKMLLFAAVVAAFASCSKSGGPTSPPPELKHQFVPDSVQAVFSENCAYPGCHAGPSPGAGLDLSPAHAYESLIDVPSRSCAPRVRVRPGQPDSSCIVDRLMGDVVPMMPLAGWIPPASRMIVVHWIAAGAPSVESSHRPTSIMAHSGARP